MRYLWILFFALGIVLTACQSSVPSIVEENLTISSTDVTKTATPSVTASMTPSITPSPTPTATATPTAPAIEIAGNPRAYTLFDPVPQSGAPCGWADTFDFPLDPPDGINAYGGDDFGTYRRRYEKFHAGEDWGLSRQNNFGKPVYSIGHGQVTYAQPLGWGADKGVVIIRHTFPDGRSVLSFYGHLDPPSVTIREGLCVNRGDIIGQIGNPRTPPHLHFEVRLHLPYSTGGGYWASDPTTAGWLSPSKTVSQARLRVAPGVVWMQEDEGVDRIPLGGLGAATYLLLDDNLLVALDLFSGAAFWTSELTEQIKDALWMPDQQVLYILDAELGLLAYQISDEREESNTFEKIELVWEQELRFSGQIELLPLPSGGVLVSQRNQLRAYSSDGNLLWTEDQGSVPAAWVLTDEALLYVIAGNQSPLMLADDEGLVVGGFEVSGIPLVAGNQIWLYAEDAIYHLDLDESSAQRLYDLPQGFLRKSAALPQSNGNLILLHTDSEDRRLISIDAEGNVQWEFSVPLLGDPQLFEFEGQIFLMDKPSYSGRGRYKTVEIYAVDPVHEQLFRVFQEGSRSFNPRDSWFETVSGEQLLMNLSDTGMVLLNLEGAMDRMGQ